MKSSGWSVVSRTIRRSPSLRRSRRSRRAGKPPATTGRRGVLSWSVAAPAALTRWTLPVSIAIAEPRPYRACHTCRPRGRRESASALRGLTGRQLEERDERRHRRDHIQQRLDHVVAGLRVLQADKTEDAEPKPDQKQQSGALKLLGHASPHRGARLRGRRQIIPCRPRLGPPHECAG